ncbi:MAG: hypothetical protein LJF04_03345 [Gemmatimonadetes bacterium]|nr:hypothetical protein [Gemmatimonadota bacterium]
MKAGGTLLTSVGQLRITSVDVVEPDAIDEADARSAGFSDLEALSSELSKREEGRVYRIELKLTGPDPRVELRGRAPESCALMHVLGPDADLLNEGGDT